MSINEAKKQAKKTPDTNINFNAGGNAIAAYVYFCSWRKRFVSYITNDGKVWY